MKKFLRLLHRVKHALVHFCTSTCPKCGSPCVCTVVHQDGEHSCGDHSW